MKSTVVDESLSTNATRVLFQRKTTSLFQALKKICEEYKDIFSLHQGDIGHTILPIIDTDTGDHPPIKQKPYMLPLKHTQWIYKELETLQKSGTISRSVFPWSSPIAIVPKKAQPGETPQKYLCVHYHPSNSLLPLVVKVHSKAQGVLS